MADFILNSSEQDVSNYLNPFVVKFNNSESIINLFKTFITAVDVLNPSDTTYNNFWTVWNLFYEKIVELCKDGDYGHTKEIIKSYLLLKLFGKKTLQNGMYLKLYLKKTTKDF